MPDADTISVPVAGTYGAPELTAAELTAAELTAPELTAPKSNTHGDTRAMH